MHRYLVISLLALFLSETAWADTLTTARSQPLRETSHQVLVSLDEGLATYRVRRTFHNSGTLAEEARLTIDLPHGAVATGLRIFAGGKWYSGELMHRDKAEALYRELTGLGPSRPKDPALLYWNWTSELGLRVFPIFPGASSLVEYTLTLPTHYEGGEYFVSYPRRHPDSRLATPQVTIGRGKLTKVDGEAIRGAVVQLGPTKVHPLIESLGWDDDRILVRSLTVRQESKKEAVAIDVDIEHTWSGDIALQLVDPAGAVHQLRHKQLSNRENNLKRRFIVKHKGSKLGTWHLLVSDHHPLDGGTLNSWSWTPVDAATKASDEIGVQNATLRDRSPVAIPQPNSAQGNIATLGLRAVGQDATHLRVGVVQFPEVPTFLRLEVDVAERLSELPKNHRVVFVLDTSRSQEAGGIEAQFRVAEAYLSHVPRAQFALVGVARRAKVLSPFVSASTWSRTVARLRQAGSLEPRNGSFLGRGLLAARSLLAGVSGSAAVVAFTDNRLRPRWSNEAVLPTVQTLPQQAVVHIVDLEPDGELLLQRRDEHRLFPLVRERGGVAVRSFGAQQGKWSLLTQEALYLVRPNRLDSPRLVGLARDNILDQGALAEGQGFRWMQEVAQAPRAVSLQGQLWSKPVEFGPEPREEFNRATAGFVFSLDHYRRLSGPQQFLIASYAGAVSPVTSYLAIEPGVRPSTIGLEEIASGVGSGSGLAAFGGLGIGAPSPRIDWAALTDQVAQACAAQRLDVAPFPVTVDHTGHEIVDVRPQVDRAAFGSCVVAELWRLQLPVGVRGDRSVELVI